MAERFGGEPFPGEGPPISEDWDIDNAKRVPDGPATHLYVEDEEGNAVRSKKTGKKITSGESELPRYEYRENVKSLAEKLENLRQGKETKSATEQLNKDELVALAWDVIDRGEKSELANNYLKTQGFKTFEDMMRRLDLRSVEVATAMGDRKVKIDESALVYLAKSPAVAEQLKRIGISSGVSAATIGATCLLGGPLLWQAAIGGVVGGVAGRAVGELYRHFSLTKKERSPTGKLERFNDVMAQNLLMKICEFQMRASELYARDEEGNEVLTDDQKAQKIYELLSESTQRIEKVDRYRDIEKKTGWIKAGASLLLSMGGSMIGSAIAGNIVSQGVENGADQNVSAQLKEATEHGVRILTDSHGVAHLALDPNQGDLYKEMADGQWHEVISNHDLQQALQVAHQRGQHDLNGILEAYYYSPSYHTLGTETVPNSLPPGVELLSTDHTLTSTVMSEAIKEHSQQIINHTTSATALIETVLPGLTGSIAADSYPPVKGNLDYQFGKVREYPNYKDSDAYKRGRIPGYIGSTSAVRKKRSYTYTPAWDKSAVAHLDIEGQRKIGAAKHPIEEKVDAVVKAYKASEGSSGKVKIEYDKADKDKFTIEVTDDKNKKVLSIPDYRLIVYEKEGTREGSTWKLKATFQIPTPRQVHGKNKDLTKWGEEANQFVAEVFGKLGAAPSPERVEVPPPEASPEKSPKERIVDYLDGVSARLKLDVEFNKEMRARDVFLSLEGQLIVVREMRGSVYRYNYYPDTKRILFFSEESAERVYEYEQESWPGKVLANHVSRIAAEVEESINAHRRPLVNEGEWGDEDDEEE